MPLQFAFRQWVLVVLLVVSVQFCQAQQISPNQAEAIAKEAYIYGAPMVQGCGAMFAYAIYKDNPQYKAPLNEIAGRDMETQH